MELKNKRILVTGGYGFLGKALMPMLEKEGANALTFSRSEYDIRKEDQVNKLFENTKPDMVIHAAVHGGGIGHMSKNPGSIYYDNIMMNSLMVEYSRIYKIIKFLGVGTVCSYPKFTTTPFKEKDLWSGYPEETNAPYGLTKKMMLVHQQAYEAQYGFSSNHLLMANMYGPYDDFDLDTSHVIPALIQRFDKAKRANSKEVVCWGTGNPTREFLYVDDGARAIVLALKNCNTSDPINVGSSEEISIKELGRLIANIIGYKGNILWDKTKPDGQPKRKLDITKAKNEFDFTAKIGFEDGLTKTIDWYGSHVKGANT
jgi:GDP-L-fucose synthase